MRHLLGVPEDESLQHYVGERGVRAVRSLERVLQGLGIAPPRGSTGDAIGERVPRPEPRKFDLGPGVDRGPVREHIPWGYGEDRVTAMPVDPDRLYVYWEVTDGAIEAARHGLGDAGGTAWLSLRVYDVTGRIFDGTNAHACFDHRVERHDRQWFFSLGRPGSTVCVDVGMKSIEGYFVRIARSGRVDLPRGGEAPPAPVEWMTVRAQTGEVEESHAGAPAASLPDRSAGDGNRIGADSPTAAGAAAEPAAAGDTADAGRRYAVSVNGWFAAAPDTWHRLRRRTEWVGDVERTSWQAGPFPHAVTPPGYEVTEERSGATRTVATPQGTIVVEQPWSVTIRGIGAHLSRRVLARWEIVRAAAFAAPLQRAVLEKAPGAQLVNLGASESLRGASEQRLASGSELRLGGASEEFLVGASELRFGGASERLVAGASESRWAGASERRWLGASELAYAGASERLVRGASEERLSGSVPGWRAGGASELRIGGSEQRLGGASEDRLAAPGAVARSARASWQAFAAAGTRLATTQPERPAAPGATRERAAQAEPDGTSASVAGAPAPPPGARK